MLYLPYLQEGRASSFQQLKSFPNIICLISIHHVVSHAVAYSFKRTILRLLKIRTSCNVSMHFKLTMFGHHHIPNHKHAGQL